MTLGLFLAIAAIGALLVPVCFVQLLYLESMRLRAREAPALDFFKEHVEDRIGLKLEEGAFAFSLVKHCLLLASAILLFTAIEHAGENLHLPEQPVWGTMAEAIALSWLGMLGVAHLLPQFFYRKTNGHWLAGLLPMLRGLVFLVKPAMSMLGFLMTLSDLGGPEEIVAEKSGASTENIEALISAGAEEGLIEEDDRKLIQSVVEFGDKTVRQVMTPRPNIVATSEEITLDELHELVVREKYSRIPVFRGDLDDITGFVHVRDLYEVDEEDRKKRKAKDIARKIDGVPETKPVDELMRMMQAKGAQMVVVVDEYGQTAGIATMEDLVEEIFGEISDEHDPTRDVIEEPGGSYLVSGNLDLDRLKELLRFRPDGETESTTIGGLVTEWMGHVPKPGEDVERDGLKMVVVASDERRVSQVRVSRAPAKGENGESEKT